MRSTAAINAKTKLMNAIANKKSLLCVGLDTDLAKLPQKLFTQDFYGLLAFNKMVIEQTQDFAAAYKINFAFYEQYGDIGFNLIRKTLEFIPDKIFTIADAKRGDIGNTSVAYSKMAFNAFNFDAITVNPYMGIDSVASFLTNPAKMVFVLALTSNPGSFDFQRLMSDNKPVYQHVVEKFANEFSADNLGFVVGATHPQELQQLRKTIPNNVILIPGVGAQGGDVEQVLAANAGAPAIINVSRAILYPSAVGSGEDATSQAVYTVAKHYRDAFGVNDVR